MIINGPVRLSLLGRATVSARDVDIPSFNGRASAVHLRVPFTSLWGAHTSLHSSSISLDNAHIEITTLTPQNIPGRIVFNNSTVVFGDRTFENIDGVLRNNRFNGSIRFGEHRYTMQTDGNYFVITNQSARLSARGQLQTDENNNLVGIGNMSLDVPNVNRFFGFDFPQINGRIHFQSDFVVSYSAISLSNIVANTSDGDITGSIEITGDMRRINLVANNMDIDFSFLGGYSDFLQNSDITFSGNGRFIIPNLWSGEDYFIADRIRVRTRHTGNTTEIRDLQFTGENINLSLRGNMIGGIADNLDTQIQTPDFSGRCLLSGNRHRFSCAPWSYRDATFSAHGNLIVNEYDFMLYINSENLSATNESFFNLQDGMSNLFGRTGGVISFNLADGVHGTATVGTHGKSLEYHNMSNTTLADMPIHPGILSSLPAQVMNVRGNITHAQLSENIISFVFDAGTWHLIVHDNNQFELTGRAHSVISLFAPRADLSSIRPNEQIRITGQYMRPHISDLNIQVGNMVFSGTFDGISFDLHGDVLDLDAIIDPNYLENYGALKFTTAAPLTVPFNLGTNVSLSAARIIWRGISYDLFNYSLIGGRQTMSITDNERGNLILVLERRAAQYHISVQATNFPLMGTLLPDTAALNIADTVVSGRANFITSGFTANDFWRNISGDVDATFTGGFLIGFGTDRLFDEVATITRMDGSMRLGDALAGGTSRLQTLHIVGRYNDGVFQTTEPLTARTRHTEYTGHIQTRGGRIRAQLQILLRGTSPVPEPVRIEVRGGGGRDFNVAEIMRNFDPDFMREFTRIHDRF